ncbi:MAG: 50S ribosomal protein L24 [Fimbriimonadaceae bacterium]|jgi:large subunit ribosomal protein L24|nr:50S ribosomal protein L24 [Fimbriimonadaceae bacterium]
MPTKAELKALAKQPKLKIRKGDFVKIIAGKDKGETGTVLAISPRELKAIVAKPDPDNDGQLIPLNAVTKHKKAKFEGQRSARFKMPSPIHISNLMVIDPNSNEPSRLGRRVEDGKIVRYAKKSGKTIVDAPQMQEKSK